MMKEIGIPFSAPMVRAILDGRKTQTRRIVKPQPKIAYWQDPFFMSPKNGRSRFRPVAPDWPDSEDDDIYCPYGQPGRRLWVREAFALPKEFDHLPPSECPHNLRFYREACPDVPGARNPRIGKWRPGMFMPRCHSRIDLEVTEIRVERLQAISESDCLAEGIQKQNVIVDCHCAGGTHTEVSEDRYFCDGCDEQGFKFAADAYAHLWESINGPGSWDANPFVWVIAFKVIP